MKKVLLSSVVVLAGIGIGFSAGEVYSLHRVKESLATEAGYFNWAGMGWMVSWDAFDANAKDAKEVLLKALQIYENGMQPQSSLDPEMKKALRLQAALTKARLSVLEDKAGNADQARSYMSAAQADLKSLGWTDCSEEAILKMIEKEKKSSPKTT